MIPTWNEAENLKLLLPELKEVLNSLFKSYEIIIMDGGSEDDSAEIVKANGGIFIKQELPGFGEALKIGFSKANGDYIVTMDADFSHGPEFIKRIWDSRNQAGAIVASRYVNGSHAQMPLYRYWLSRILNSVFTICLSLPLRDISSNFRLYRRDIIQSINIVSSGYEALEEILIKILAQGWTIYEVPFVYRPRSRGKSHVQLLKFALTYLKTFLSMWYLRNSIDFSDYDLRAFYSRIFLQRWWQRKRYKIIMGYLKSNNSILDIGCGSSKIIIDLPLAVGLDIDIGKLRYLKKTNSRLINADAGSLPFKDNSFSTVICSEVIEHIEAENIFSEINRVLKKDGLLIVGTPDYGLAFWPFIEKLYSIFHKGGYAGKHTNPYTSRRLFDILNVYNFEILAHSYILKSELIIKARKKG